MKSINIHTLENLRFNANDLPIFTLYKNPKELPYQYVLRVFIHDVPTAYFIHRNTFEEIQKEIPSWAVFIPRDEADDPCIAGTWV